MRESLRKWAIEREVGNAWRAGLRGVKLGWLLEVARQNRAQSAPSRPAYLSSVRESADGGVRIASNGPNWIPLVLCANGKRRSSLEVDLATGRFELSLRAPWEMSFSDAEDAYALHRFHWVLSALAQTPDRPFADQAWSIVLNWIDSFSSRPEGPEWQSYTVAERIVNWLILYQVLSRSGVRVRRRRKFLASVCRQAQHLLTHLEYYGPGRTFNHILQDARALYLAARVFGNESWATPAREILLHEAGRMFSESGFLGEDSSHYHWLVCRSYVEVLRLAETTLDPSFHAALKPFVRRFLTAALFFLPDPRGSLPLIGDVSPDCPPEWLKCVPFVGLRWLGESSSSVGLEGAGWHRVWHAGRRRASWAGSRTQGTSLRDGEWTSFPDAGWHRFRNPTYTIFWHAPGLVRPRYTSHGHADADAFELHWKGEPFIVDTGRSTYEQTAFGWSGKTPWAHNSILIDGQYGFVVFGANWNPRMPRGYSTASALLDVEVGSSSRKVTFQHDGFSRFGRSIRVRREFICASHELVIRDSILGSGTRKVTTLFHFHPTVEVESCDHGALGLRTPGAGRVRFSWQDGGSCSARMVQGRSDPHPLGWYSGRYGSLVPTWTLVLERATSLPFVSSVRIRKG